MHTLLQGISYKARTHAGELRSENQSNFRGKHIFPWEIHNYLAPRLVASYRFSGMCAGTHMHPKGYSCMCVGNTSCTVTPLININLCMHAQL